MRVRLVELSNVATGLSAALLRGLSAPWIAGDVQEAHQPPLRPGAPLDAAAALLQLPAPRAGEVVIGLTSRDLAFPPLAYVVGVSPLGERTGLVSYARLAPATIGQAADVTERASRQPDVRANVLRVPALGVLRRLTTAVVHELGHAVGLVHCAVPHCAMHASSAPERIDLKQPEYCPTCREQLRRATTADGDASSGSRGGAASIAATVRRRG